MKTNDLKNAKDLFGYDPTTGRLWWLSDGRPAGHINDRGYRIIEYQGKRYKAHRVAWTIFHSQPPKGEIDHLNQNKSDNRIVNLQDTCCQTNMMNRPMQKNNKSGFNGVFWHKRDKKWVAKIKHRKRHIWLGRFDTKEEAIEIRKIADQIYDFSDNHGDHTKVLP